MSDDQQIARASPALRRSLLPPSLQRNLAPILHGVALLSLTNSFRLLYEPSPISQYMATQFGGHFAYLTVLSLAASWLTFVAALLLDVFPSNQVIGNIKTALQILCVPAEGIVTILYWGMTAVNPSLLLPEDPIFRLPLSLDIGLHFLPALFLWADFLLFSPPMSKDTDPLLVAASAVLAYSTWCEYSSSINLRFPYPFLNDMSQAGRAAFYLSIIPLVIGLFHLANYTHKWLSPRHSIVPAK